jgi:hypothetical protein
MGNEQSGPSVESSVPEHKATFASQFDEALLMSQSQALADHGVTTKRRVALLMGNCKYTRMFLKDICLKFCFMLQC